MFRNSCPEGPKNRNRRIRGFIKKRYESLDIALVIMTPPSPDGHHNVSIFRCNTQTIKTFNFSAVNNCFVDFLDFY
jgi:hypothetical protein